ncbi:hypothetical protein EV426DRAFT_66574 [Tirmania nivea]|nr:hypothetical protein EV426DRAFT_66574 [Tirmania nivea]
MESVKPSWNYKRATVGTKKCRKNPLSFFVWIGLGGESVFVWGLLVVSGLAGLFPFCNVRMWMGTITCILTTLSFVFSFLRCTPLWSHDWVIRESDAIVRLAFYRTLDVDCFVKRPRLRFHLRRATKRSRYTDSILYRPILTV